MLRAQRAPAEAPALARRALQAHPEQGLAWALWGGARGSSPHVGRAEAFRKALEQICAARRARGR